MLFAAKITIGATLSWIEISTDLQEALQNAGEQILKKCPSLNEKITIELKTALE